MGVEGIVFFACYAGYVWMLCGFCESCFSGSRMSRGVFALFLFSLGALANTVAVRISVPYIFYSLTYHASFVAGVVLVFRDVCYKKISVAMLLAALRTLVWNFGCSFFSCGLLACEGLVARGRVTGIDLQTDYLIGAAAYCLAAFVLSALQRRLVHVFEHKTKSWHVMVAVLLGAIVLMVEIVNWGASNGIMVVSNAGGIWYRNLFYDQIFSHAGICLLTALSMCMALGTVFGMHRIDEEQRQKERYHAQTEYYRMLDEQYAQLERLRHDMKNHVLALRGLWESGQFEEMGDYLGGMLTRGGMDEADVLTGSRAVDALVYHKAKQAKQNKIRFTCDVQLPEEHAIEEFDLCVLFGNLLDNALHGCMEVQDETHRFICVRAETVKKCFLLVVRNGTLLPDAGGVKAGTGVHNVMETAKKYDGIVDICIKAAVFEISVLLPLCADGCDGNVAD